MEFSGQLSLAGFLVPACGRRRAGAHPERPPQLAAAMVGPYLLRRRGDRPDPGDHRRVRHRAAGQLRDGAVRRAGGHHRSARQVLLGPADRPVHAAHARPRPLRAARRRRATLWGRTEFRGWGGSSHPDVTSRREGFSTEAQYRREPARQRAGQDDARLPARADPAGRVGGRARRRRGRHRRRWRRGRQGRLARRDRALERSRVRRRALPARALRRDAGASAARAGTRATSTSTPSTRRSATRP